MPLRWRLVSLLVAGLLAAATPSADTPAARSLLFHASADRSTTADTAAGDREPNFQSAVTIVGDGRRDGAFHVPDDGYVTWKAPGNMYAQRGTVAFFWRAQAPLGVAPFVIFRAGFADHSSWDMCFLRIDWNGHGFDAFVTDANLARVRTSFKLPQVPAASAWLHLAFGWDETLGVRLYVDGNEVSRVDTRADLDAGLDQFGFAGRIIAPHQVQSRYSFMRGSDIDDLRVYDHLLTGTEIARLSAPDVDTASAPQPAPGFDADAWRHRYGWDRSSPPALDAAVTRIAKVEFADARDLKEWMFKGVDGIDETTWPGVYNRSRLPGRNDYFTLPDWNTYVEGGQSYVLTVPTGARFNRVEIRGAAFGALEYAADGTHFEKLASRTKGVVRSADTVAQRTGGVLRFTNTDQETPIQELWAYDVAPGEVPRGSLSLTYTVQSGVDTRSYPALDALNDWIAGRFPAGERTTVVAIPSGAGAPRAAAAAGNAADGAPADRRGPSAPLVHVLIPSTFAPAPAGRPVARAWNYGWENVYDGLDGIALDLPALRLAPQADGVIPLAIRIEDPIWPGRHLIDVSVSVRPGQARTVWLDTRDRILTRDSLALSIASAAALDAASLEGMSVRLIFKPRKEAVVEHVADRFNQVRDNWGYLVEEHTSSQRASLYRRVYADISDLLRVDPDHVEGRRYWSDINYGAPGWPATTVAAPPAGVPPWAFFQLQDLKLVRQFVDWWIDNRQVDYGDFGGGISDDTDLLQQWPGLALMGVEPDRINASLRALTEAVYRNGMMTGGLSTIVTDELHAYEDGINSNAERLYLNWGEPIAVERLMSTVAALRDKVLLVNPTGHMHFASNWYGAGTVYREGSWEWQKPYSFTVMHAPMLVGLYNGNPVARGLVTGTIDGLMAHGKQDARGGWTFPNEINWRSDAERVGDGAGVISPTQSAWAAWRFTGDEKYLRPVIARVASGGLGALGEFNENLLAELRRPEWQASVNAGQASGGEFARYARWNETGDPGSLELLHTDAIVDKTNRMYMNTEGHPWTDRAEQIQSDILQRERLGGVALRRNQTWPGHTVSWRFTDAGAAEQVAILMPGATPSHFTVTAFNTGDRSQRASMTTWNVTAGRWRITSADGTRELPLERSASVDLSFAPHAESRFEFTLIAAGTPVESRPDLGIGLDDVRVESGVVNVTVHSLGARPTPGGEVVVQDARGRVLARARVAPLEAPLDLNPRVAPVRLQLPAGTATSGLVVRVSLATTVAELTLLNNAVTLP